MDNPFSLIILAARKALLEGKVPEEELGEERLTIVRAMIACGKYSHEKIERFIFFLKNFLYIENEEINRKFDTAVDALTGRTQAIGIIETINQLTREKGIKKGIQLGIEKGIVTGIQQGSEKKSYEVVENLIVKLGLSDEQITDVANVSLAFVKKVRRELNKKK